jgi:uncharacterized protein YjbJ (UPF0337 family)
MHRPATGRSIATLSTPVDGSDIEAPNRSRPCSRTQEKHMGEKTDQAKGRIKEAAGDLTDDKDLKNEGKVDQASGSVKEKVGDAVDKVKDALHRD